MPFVGVSGAATDTAGNFPGLSPKGIAEPAMVVATGEDLPVALGAGLMAPSLFLLSLKGTAEFAAVVTGGEPPVLLTGSELLWAFAGGAAEGAAEVAA